MDPIFTIPYSEYRVAEMLSKDFQKNKGFSLYVPMSRQEKGVDLLILQRNKNISKTASIQIKSSRTYDGVQPKRRTDRRKFSYYTWFNCFEVQESADFYILYSIYPVDNSRSSNGVKKYWVPFVMVFTNEEMKSFIDTRVSKSGLPERFFGFGFDDAKSVFAARADHGNEYENYSKNIYNGQDSIIRKYFASI